MRGGYVLGAQAVEVDQAQTPRRWGREYRQRLEDVPGLLPARCAFRWVARKMMPVVTRSN